MGCDNLSVTFNPQDVWYDEVNHGFYEFVRANISCEYEEGIYTPINTVILTGEQDLSDLIYPMCAIYPLGNSFSKDRNDNRTPVQQTDLPYTNLGWGERLFINPSQPYYLEYQIIFYANYRSDIDHITKCWCKATGRALNLPIKLADNTPHKVATDLIESKHISDLNREVRKFAHYYLYKVWVDLEGGTFAGKTVTEVVVEKIK